MANRRFGGAGSQRGPLNRSFPPSSNINPWQGGVAPDNANNNIQRQLALALTSLIQQTQPNTPDGPPSLLSMNTSPGFCNQDQYNNQNNRFVNRGRQDFRRPEPYNKNRGGWRSDSNNRNSRGGSNFSSKNRSNFRDKNQRSPAGDKNKNDKKSNDKSPSKQERSTDNVEDRKETEPKPEVELGEEPKPDGDTKRTPKPTKYDGLPNGLLHCFVCNKSMWDGESFQNHIGGKAHKQMIGSLEESFQITVNILRENMRLCEERKMIEYERMQRSRRYHHNNAQEPESHCNMCDLKFMGKIVVHRQTEAHQRLKRFLHPKCRRCNLEFPSRMEWVDHQFAPDHLFKLKEYLDTKNLEPGEYKVKVQAEMDNEPLLEENVQNEDDYPVLELDEELTNLFNRIPVYKSERAVSKNSVSAASGFICDLCKLFMPSEEEKETHLKSSNHYQAFVEAVKSKYQKAATEKKKKTDDDSQVEGEEKDEDGNADAKDEDMYDPFVTEDGEGEADADADAEAEGEGDGEELNKEEEDKILNEENPEEEAEAPNEVEKKEAPVEEKKTPATPTTPSTPNTRAKRGIGAVKNGAGPKSKKVRN